MCQFNTFIYTWYFQLFDDSLKYFNPMWNCLPSNNIQETIIRQKTQRKLSILYNHINNLSVFLGWNIDIIFFPKILYKFYQDELGKRTCIQIYIHHICDCNLLVSQNDIKLLAYSLFISLFLSLYSIIKYIYMLNFFLQYRKYDKHNSRS